jgi:vacuolar-type H+-ATPase subunit E/Vma4
MPKNKKNMSKEELEEKEAVIDFVSSIVQSELDEIEETVEKTDIREIAKKAVEAKGVVATEQHINDYIVRFNLA